MANSTVSQPEVTDVKLFISRTFMPADVYPSNILKGRADSKDNWD